MTDFTEKALLKIETETLQYLQKEVNSPFYSVLPRIENKIPEELREKLQEAYYKAFEMLFEKGGKVIEKTYDAKQRKIDYRVMDITYDVLDRERAMNGFQQLTQRSRNRSLGISTIEGGVLGFFGVGLPDIPIQMGVLLRSVFEIAEQYGYDHNQSEEEYLILKMMEVAFSSKDEQKQRNAEVDSILKMLESGTPLEFDLKTQMRNTANIMAETMLALKFVQTFMVVGVIGGMSDVVFCRRMTEYTDLKYRKRYLLQKTKKRKNKCDTHFGEIIQNTNEIQSLMVDNKIGG